MGTCRVGLPLLPSAVVGFADFEAESFDLAMPEFEVNELVVEPALVVEPRLVVRPAAELKIWLLDSEDLHLLTVPLQSLTPSPLTVLAS